MILFHQDRNFIPPVELEELSLFYKEQTENLQYMEKESFDILIAGAGIAGICAALSAARRGLKTALIQDRPVVGGNNCSEVRVWFAGDTNFEPFPRIGNIVAELEQKEKAHYGSSNVGSLYEDDKKLDLLRNQENLTLLLDHVFLDVETEDDQIRSAEILDVKNNCYKRFEARWFVDAMGDATGM